ncbi:MAG: NAD-binding protein [Oscillospiraceae bacterium]|jgi:trk system potassium uptake protein TrkA
MKIGIGGGRNKADFLIGMLLDKKHKLVVICDDEKYCEYLADTHDIPIVIGDPCKQYVLDEAHIKNFDVLIALKPDDADNLAICQMAKRIYNIKKNVCIVSNPKNVDVFKKLGVNTVISATYMIANRIEQASTIESLIKTLSLDDEKAVISEILIEKHYPVTDKKMLLLAVLSEEQI